MKKYVFYHNDSDGKCAAAIIKMYDMSYELFSIDYDVKDQFPFNMIRKDDIVMMVDFSLDTGDMIKLNNLCNFVWIDHHISAIEKLADTHIDGLQAVELDGSPVSACYLVWKYLHPNLEIPKFVQYISDFDVHNIKNPEGGFFENYLRSQDCNPNDVIFWKTLFDERVVDEMTTHGQIIEKYINNIQKFYLKNAFEVKFDGLNALFINTRKLNSNLFDSVRDDKYDLYISAFMISKRKWVISLQSMEGGVDVSKIAAKYYGGGHKHAAGFVTEKFPFWGQ